MKGRLHQVPLALRFGGWHLTDVTPAVAPLANVIGRSSAGKIDQLPKHDLMNLSLTHY